MKKLAALTIAAAALAASAIPATAGENRSPTAEARTPEVVVVEGRSDLLIRVPKKASLACIRNKSGNWTSGHGDCEPMDRVDGRYEAQWRGRKVAVGKKLVVLIIGGVYRDGRKYTVRVKSVDS